MSEFEVRLTERTRSRMLTKYVTNLDFGDVDPGGYGNVSFDLPRDVNAEDFEEGAEIAVFDVEDGEQVGGARLLNPGRGIDPTTGEGIWKVAGIGEGLAHTQERKVPLFIADSRLDRWKSGASTSPNREWSQGAPPQDSEQSNTGLVFQINQASVGINAFTNVNFYDPLQFGREIAGYKITHREGRTSTSSELEFQLRSENGSGNLDVLVATWQTGERTSMREVGTHWADGGDRYKMNLVYVRRTTADTANDPETQWILVTQASIFGKRLDRTGAEIIGGGAYSKGYVTADEAIIDTWARLCPRFDLLSARIDAGVYQHTNLVWPDGINTYDLMAFLMELEQGFTWAVWEKQPNGKYRAEWRARDTEVRYEIPEVDAFDVTGGQDERLTKLYYTGDTSAGRYKSVNSEEADANLAAQGIEPTDTRQISLEGVEGWDWEDEAYARATQELEDSRYRATAAQATVSRRVFDRRTGRWIKPHKMKSGYLCRIPNVRSRLDTLNASQSEGAAIFRITSKQFSAAAQQARLDLNSYTRDESRAIADLLIASKNRA